MPAVALRTAPRRRKAAKSWLAALLWIPCLAFAQSPAALTYQVEAVFLFNFTQFVTWPTDAFSAPAEPFRICVLGQDPFGRYLDEVVAGEHAQGRSLAVRRLNAPGEMADCHVLFIGRSENARMSEIVAQAGTRPLLTVSEAEDFDKRGGMVRFIVENRRVRLRINVESARAAGLAISSKLLRIAEIVSTERP